MEEGIGMTKDTALSGSDNLCLVRIPGQKQGDRARRRREGGGWIFGEKSCLGLGHLWGVRLGSGMGRCVLLRVHPSANESTGLGS